MIEAVKELSPELLSDTAAHDDLESGFFVLQAAQGADEGEHLLFGLFTDRTGIEKDHVRGLDIVDRYVTQRREETPYAEGIVFVHLATEGANVEIKRTLSVLRRFWHLLYSPEKEYEVGSGPEPRASSPESRSIIAFITRHAASG